MITLLHTFLRVKFVVRHIYLSLKVFLEDKKKPARLIKLRISLDTESFFKKFLTNLKLELLQTSTAQVFISHRIF